MIDSLLPLSIGLPTAQQPESQSIRIGNRTLATRYFLAPLAGYTHLAFRRVVRECGGVGLATTDLVQAAHLIAGTKWARELVTTHPEDQPLSVQIYGGVAAHIVQAAKWLEDHGYAAVDINMGCPMAKITGQGGGARLMCDTDGACQLVGQVVAAVRIPVTVKMRLGWDREQISAPVLAREFERLGVAAITIHGRTRAQGFRGAVDLDGIRAVVEAVETIPVVGNGDVRSVADAWRMRTLTGCSAVAIGRGALIDPWIFRRLQLAAASGDDRTHLRTNYPSPLVGEGWGGGRASSDVFTPTLTLPHQMGSEIEVGSRSESGTSHRESDRRLTSRPPPRPEFQPTPSEQIDFLARHFYLMVEQHGEFHSCRMFRKFAAWSGAHLGIPEDLEDRLRRFESIAEFDQIVAEIRLRHGTRRDSRPTAEIKVPNGPVEYW